MGLLSRVFGSRPDESAVTQAVASAVLALPGVSAHSLTYNHQQYGSGALHGVVDVADTPAFLEVLRTSLSVLSDLGLAQPPTGRDLVGHLST